MTEALRILLLEDEAADAGLVQAEMDAEEISCRIDQVASEADFVDALERGGVDLIFADSSLPGFDGLSALSLARHRRPEVPFIFVSGTLGEDLAIETLKSGATDYVLKSKLSRLGPAVRRALRDAKEQRERRAFEEKIREQAALLDLAQDSIIVLDLKEQIEFWNKGAERLYGWTAGETSGLDIRAWLYSDGTSFQAARKAVLERGEWNGELQHAARDGRKVVLNSRWTLLRDERGEPASILWIGTDVSEKKQLEAQFLRVQRMESIGRLASGVAHDLNNILAPILISVPMLRWGLTDAEFEKMLATIEVSAQRGADLVKQLLILGRGVEGERSVVQLTRLIGEMVKIAQETFPKTISIQSEMPKDLWPVLGDATQLHQVILNLCVNARDAMPGGGVLRVTAENVRFDEHYLSLNPEATAPLNVAVRVSDNGSGISSQIIDKIFDPFFTTKGPRQGSGLGLSTVLGIVKSHGGFISVHTQEGEGSTFEIFLPASTEAEVAESGAPARSAPRGRGELILVVDDEANILDATQRVLKRHGYEVVTAANGVEAVSLYAQQGRRIKAVLTDLIMPLMDGLTLVRVLKRMEPNVRFIACSGMADIDFHEEKIRELACLGVPTFLSKPYTGEKLLTALHELLQGSG